MAQLAEQSLLTSEIRGSNPNIGKVFRIYLCISVNCNSEKTKIKKVAGIGQITYSIQSAKVHRRSQSVDFRPNEIR